MSRLRKYFESAQTIPAAARRVGLEVETLFVDGSGRPLDERRAREIFRRLVEEGWSASGDPPGTIWELKRGDFQIKPEVGAGNIELISPPRPVDELDTLLEATVDELGELYRAADQVGANPLEASFDGSQHVDNVLLPNARDEKWARVDGRGALKYLGHIASVHATFDLVSLDEAFEWVEAVGRLSRRRSWPAPETERVWRDYLRDSKVDYARARMGPAPSTFASYLEKLRSFSVVMDSDAEGGLRRLTPNPPTLSEIETTVDLPLFLGTVWFQTRLRVVEGRLALEIRVIPRRGDAHIGKDLRDLLTVLDLD